jgi:hypothetical protein
MCDRRVGSIATRYGPTSGTVSEYEVVDRQTAEESNRLRHHMPTSSDIAFSLESRPFPGNKNELGLPFLKEVGRRGCEAAKSIIVFLPGKSAAIKSEDS